MRWLSMRDPMTLARIKRASRCPDCASDVTVHGAVVDVRHDVTCPTWRARSAPFAHLAPASDLLLLRPWSRP